MRAALALLLLAGCTAEPACSDIGAKPARVAEVFFGRDVPGRAPVSEAEWTEFARTVITPHLPDGFTVLDGKGQWRDPETGRVAREDSKILLVALPGRSDTAALQAIAAAWKAAFHQQSVGVVVQRGCAAF